MPKREIRFNTQWHSDRIFAKSLRTRYNVQAFEIYLWMLWIITHKHIYIGQARDFMDLNAHGTE